ncbi:MAG: alkane 1-monooxygenase [Marinoscillum sp.]
MKNLMAYKYLSVLTLPALAFISFTQQGWITFLPLIEAFALIPLLELFFQPNPENFNEEQERQKLNNPLYDALVYLVVPVQFYCLWLFLNSMNETLDPITIIGRISAMGLLCGVMGINVAHELGHRKKRYEQWLSKALLLTSLYMHFFIEHNRGHHKHVSTSEDPSSARRGESLYAFWFRSVIGSYLSAWRLESKRLAKNGKSYLSISNEMIHFHFIQGIWLLAIYWYFGWVVLGYYFITATIGFLLLETVNYIEHYGLTRSKNGDRYERTMPEHSWNSNHVMGRMMLFELSRHSDHHYIASRKYQVLRYMDESPQMPTGYPGMMLLATIPPLWFRVMDGMIDNFKKTLK